MSILCPLTARSAVTSTPFAHVAGKAQSADWLGLTSVPSGLDTADSRISALESLMSTMQGELAAANTTISTQHGFREQNHGFFYGDYMTANSNNQGFLIDRLSYGRTAYSTI